MSKQVPVNLTDEEVRFLLEQLQEDLEYYKTLAAYSMASQHSRDMCAFLVKLEANLRVALYQND